MMKGKLYLIPSPLGDYDPDQILPGPVLETACRLKTFVVEEIRTARRFLSRAGLKGQIDTLSFYELNEHTKPEEVERMGSLFDDGQDVGLISEAGLPAVADPGAQLVALCHRNGIEVIPLVGPSSLMLALMGSGLNGQSFAFCGYLPAKTQERRNAIHRIEKRSAAERQTQIFIETPYRNESLFRDLIATCAPHTLITVAINLTMPDAMIRTRTAGQWKQSGFVPDKRPCVFLLLAQHP